MNCNLRPSPQNKLLPYNPVLDDQGILRSAGRLKYAPLPESTRLPIILDAKNPLVKLLVEHSHAVCHHAGPEYVKAFLQQRYLIIGVRSALRSVSHRCFDCRRFRAENIQPFMAPLPPFRYLSRDAPFPFAQTGIDLFGPFFIGRGQIHIHERNGRTFGKTLLDRSGVSKKKLTKSHNYSRLFSK